MEFPQETDDFVNNSIGHTLTLLVPRFLESKIKSLETTNYNLRGQYHSLQLKLKEKEAAIELAKSESAINAQAIKKFVEENQKLANECKCLVDQRNKWESECAAYHHDREVLMELGNEAQERAEGAQIRVTELEEELMKISDELKYYKHQYEALSDDSSVDGPRTEQFLLNTLLASLVNKNEVEKMASAFLEANSGVETCSKLLKMWNSLRPETQNVLSLASQIRTLQEDKDHLRVNLHRAEDEVNILAEENNVLLRENKRLLKLYNSDRKRSGEKHDCSARTKSHRRNSSHGMSSPVEKQIDFNDAESLRYSPSPPKELTRLQSAQDLRTNATTRAVCCSLA